MNPDERPDDMPDLNELMKHLMGGGDDMREALSELGLGNIDPAMFAQMQQQMAAMMAAPSDGSFNIEAARDVARKTVAAEGDPSISATTARDVDQVVMVANLWLDQVTDFSSTGAGKAWSRSEWVEATMPTWRRLVEPVSDAVNAAVMRAMREQITRLGSEQFGMPPQMMGQLEPMLGRMSSAVFSMQLGQAVGTLAGELVTGTEVGLPLVEGNPVVVMPTNVAAFAEGLGVDAGEIHLYLAVREAARTRLFKGVPWLGPALIAAVQSYAADISIDTEAIEEAMGNADMQDPTQLQEALAGSIFRPEPSEAQQRTLKHLETLLALVEGWVDVISDRAARPHLPNVDALSEAIRRRRATGGPAEKVFASLVGLELRPRRMRDAAALFTALEDAKGQQGRDEAWKHPDFAPSAADLDDPSGYVAGTERKHADTSTDAVDDALAALLAQGEAEMAQEDKPEDDEKPGS
ncbi:zinc-dependent metalloprotease [Yimella sp. cx-51]|uniref:zinc-dependent metalloprotease n=1 Tax=Yimella sp. cx-51 TaxID=2770551 RepID=UPI00165DE489|nr:zinc-dependent metalloprotease [Yimella sp. cx-51]MBC9956077.1 zinc-dependent metalloprotease [Yimella sp. cx-51]QTH37392.1 zinc-dependent metalloprotease [Yimella sp. cx-51]